MSRGFGKFHLLSVWILLLCALAALCAFWMMHEKSLAAMTAAAGDLSVCKTSIARLKLHDAETSEKLKGCIQQRQSLQKEKDTLAEALCTERAMPRGSLGEFFLKYKRFASSLRFSAKLQVEYQVNWKLEEDVPAGKNYGDKDDRNRALSAMGKSSLLHGVYLGRRSNFAFGLLVIGDDDISLRVPSSQQAFSPPAAKVVKRKMWLDKEVKYIPGEPHIRRVLHVSIVALGQHKLPTPIGARLVRVWREQDKGFCVLVIGTNEAPDGIDSGPPYISEQAWLSSLDKLGLFALTAPNAGLVLYKERLSVGYAEDRENLPEANRSIDYYREGWLRTEWDSNPGRLAVLFAPLSPGEQDSIVPKIHSLVFPMIESRSYWLPFWSVRERLLATRKLDLTVIPAFDLESQRLPFMLSALPTVSAGKWNESVFQSSLYDLLKRKTSSR